MYWRGVPRSTLPAALHESWAPAAAAPTRRPHGALQMCLLLLPLQSQLAILCQQPLPLWLSLPLLPLMLSLVALLHPPCLPQ